MQSSSIYHEIYDNCHTQEFFLVEESIIKIYNVNNLRTYFIITNNEYIS